MYYTYIHIILMAYIENYIIYTYIHSTCSANTQQWHSSSLSVAWAPLIEACDPILPHVPLLVAHRSEHRAFLLPHAGLGSTREFRAEGILALRSFAPMV